MLKGIQRIANEPKLEFSLGKIPFCFSLQCVCVCVVLCNAAYCLFQKKECKNSGSFRQDRQETCLCVCVFEMLSWYSCSVKRYADLLTSQMLYFSTVLKICPVVLSMLFMKCYWFEVCLRCTFKKDLSFRWQCRPLRTNLYLKALIFFRDGNWYECLPNFPFLYFGLDK